MEDKSLTPPTPLVRGEPATVGVDGPPAPITKVEPDAPSPDKGRAGEGLPFLPYNKNLTALARENRNNPTPAETLLWQKVLRGKQFANYKFLRQKPIGPYIVDFYCAELRLVIEIDGDSHAEQAGYDAQRTAHLNSLGLSVLRYANRDVLSNLPSVFDNLASHLQSDTP